eukprot:TRINITY_DN240_c0_g1_i2.p3 TRINITY_DN240_c0_g1~~TRINITY_DN240_c0_g1_i2.p3  ORF type:complete len:120 (-),score=22.94 TRINITY_DN240_c0_g1_i2:345-659(-)
MSDSEGEVDDKQEVEEKETKGGKSGKKLEVKKWNAVALWAWDIVVDNCAICRNHIMDLCAYLSTIASLHRHGFRMRLHFFPAQRSSQPSHTHSFCGPHWPSMSD